MTTANKPEPPSLVVLTDPHWKATQAKLHARRRPVAKLVLCDDEAVTERLRVAWYKAQAAQIAADSITDDPDVQRLVLDTRAELEAAQQAYEEASVELCFQALPRTEFEQLQRKHPPTDDQAAEGMAFNAEALGAELVARSSLDGISVQDAHQFLTQWSLGDATQLFDAAWNVQMKTRGDTEDGPGAA